MTNYTQQGDKAMDQQQYGRKLTVDSKTNCYKLPDDGFELLQAAAATAELMPGIHVIRINKGTFSFFPNGSQPQPSVLLWIRGGMFKNKASDMPVNFNWSCLNGYNETCTIEVMNGVTTLHALFIDDFDSDNVGQIELSILSQNDEVASDSLSETEEIKFAKVTECACAAAAAPDETAKKVSGWYELENEDGLFRFVLKAGNGEVILRGEQHEEKESAESDIALAQDSCAKEERYEKTISEGKPCFNLMSATWQLIGSSQPYSSEASCSKGMASVKRNGSSDVIKEMAEAAH
jgi:uncharacterized protein YegP (UPF0339 family)